MKITTEQLTQHLARKLDALYIVFGDEPLLALEACDRIRTSARDQGYVEREVLTVETGFKWQQLAMAAGAQSLFASRKLLELRIPNGKPGVEGGEALQKLCSAMPADTVILVQLPAVDWRSQKSAWFEALERKGTAVEARTVQRQALPQWLAGRLKAQKQQADPETLAFMVERVEGNLMAAYQEVQKLALLLPPGPISDEQVREAVLDVARYDVFGLGEALAEGDTARLARMLDGLKGEGCAPPLVLWALTEEIRAIGKLLEGISQGRALSMPLWREARVRGQRHQEALQKNLPRFSRKLVEEALRHAAAIDRLIKGIGKGDVWDELLQLTLRFVRGRAAKPAARIRA